jgi:hypothetical protein
VVKLAKVLCRVASERAERSEASERAGSAIQGLGVRGDTPTKFRTYISLQSLENVVLSPSPRHQTGR